VKIARKKPKKSARILSLRRLNASVFRARSAGGSVLVTKTIRRQIFWQIHGLHFAATTLPCCAPRSCFWVRTGNFSATKRTVLVFLLP
jgi:hypothetical protein